MRRWHFYVMGFVALAYGLLSMAEYVMVSYGLQAGWLRLYPADQVAWLASLPDWVHGVWGFHATIALVGALCLLAHVRAAVWMLAFATLSLIVLYVWMLGFAVPTLVELVGGGWTVWLALALVMLLSLLIYVYARQEKRRGEVL